MVDYSLNYSGLTDVSVIKISEGAKIGCKSIQNECSFADPYISQEPVTEESKQQYNTLPPNSRPSHTLSIRDRLVTCHTQPKQRRNTLAEGSPTWSKKQTSWPGCATQMSQWLSAEMGGIILTAPLITTSGLPVYRKSYVSTQYVDLELIYIYRKNRTRCLLTCCPRILTAPSMKRIARRGRRMPRKPYLLQARENLRRQNRNELFEPFVLMYSLSFSSMRGYRYPLARTVSSIVRWYAQIMVDNAHNQWFERLKVDSGDSSLASVMDKTDLLGWASFKGAPYFSVG